MGVRKPHKVHRRTVNDEAGHMARLISVTLGAGTNLTWQQQRNALVPGTYDPGPDTTGVNPSTNHIVVTSPSQLPGGAITPGATYTGYDFQFFFDPPTSDIPITTNDCIYSGPATYTSSAETGLCKFFDTGHAPMVLNDCTIKAQNPLPQVNGLHGYRFTARRCDISYVADAISSFRGASNLPAGPVEVDVQQCWLHDLVWMSQAACAALGVSVPADGKHCDVWQHQGGTGAIVKYNTMSGYTAPEFFNTYYDNSGRANATIIYQNNVGSGAGSVTGADIQYNLVSGGRATTNYTTGSGGNLNDVGIYKNNRHVRDSATAAILRPTISPFTCDFGSAGPPDTRNIYTDNGAVVPLTNSGQ